MRTLREPTVMPDDLSRLRTMMTMRGRTLAIHIVAIAAVAFGVLLMHGLTTPAHAMRTPSASMATALGVDHLSVSTHALDMPHAAGAVCVWVLTGGIAAAVIRRLRRTTQSPVGDRPTSPPASPRRAWTGPAPPGQWSYLELASLRR